MDDGKGTGLPWPTIDRRIRHALRILENEQTPLPETADVAARVGLSPFYFMRRFTAQVGLSPQDYGRAVLLSCAASRLRYSDETVAIVASDFGYARQAAFNKAFTRHHGVAPARWRRDAKAAIVPVPGEGVRLEHRPGRRCLARRSFGPRSLWAAHRVDFVARLPARLRGRPLVDFSYDDPRVTPPGRIRHDSAVEVADGYALPDALADDGFELLQSPAGLWAMAEVLPDRIGEGYRAVFDGWFRGRPGYAMEGDPFLELWGAAPDGAPRVTVCVRVRLVEAEGAFNMTVLEPGAAAPDGPGADATDA